MIQSQTTFSYRLKTVLRILLKQIWTKASKHEDGQGPSLFIVFLWCSCRWQPPCNVSNKIYCDFYFWGMTLTTDHKQCHCKTRAHCFNHQFHKYAWSVIQHGGGEDRAKHSQLPYFSLRITCWKGTKTEWSLMVYIPLGCLHLLSHKKHFMGSVKLLAWWTLCCSLSLCNIWWLTGGWGYFSISHWLHPSGTVHRRPL